MAIMVYLWGMFNNGKNGKGKLHVWQELGHGLK